MPPDRDFDIARSMKIIEGLKARLLGDLANLYGELSIGPMDRGEAGDSLAGIILTAYLLSDKLGIGFEELSNTCIKRLRYEALKDESGEVSRLLEHLQNRHNI